MAGSVVVGDQSRTGWCCVCRYHNGSPHNDEFIVHNVDDTFSWSTGRHTAAMFQDAEKAQAVLASMPDYDPAKDIIGIFHPSSFTCYP